MKISIFNLGCKVNQYECDAIGEQLALYGHDVSFGLTEADVYILNTCAVTSEAERKSRQAIARCKNYNPNAKIIVMGCASQKSPESFVKDDVIYICGTAEKKSVIEHINSDCFETNISELPLNYDELPLHTNSRTRSYIKIQDGCNNFCSYCIIPFLRGRSRSRNIEGIIAEAEELSSKTKEIVLTGIDIMSFGKDTGTSLTELLRKLKHIDARIRLSSIYAEKITEEMLEALFGLKKFCPQFHLSLQSGDNKILKDMNRHYTAEEYLSKINLIRSIDANAAITTDIIVGYPTETDEKFVGTCNFVREANFSDLHIFPFSSRSGTRAAKLTPIPKDVMNFRKKAMAEIKNELHKNYLEKNIGIKQEVLIEEKINGYNIGYPRNYIRIYTEKTGEIIEVTPTTLYKDGLKEV